jgi:hypothetical protein
VADRYVVREGTVRGAGMYLQALTGETAAWGSKPYAWTYQDLWHAQEDAEAWSGRVVKLRARGKRTDVVTRAELVALLRLVSDEIDAEVSVAGALWKAAGVLKNGGRRG